MCNDILNNREWYRIVIESFLKNCKIKFTELVFQAYNDDLINKETLEFLLIKYPKTPTFYALPKIHKWLKDPLGRPIISRINSLTSNASRLMDDYLCPPPHVMALHSYMKDSFELLKRIKGPKLPLGSILVTIDVESL